LKSSVTALNGNCWQFNVEPEGNTGKRDFFFYSSVKQDHIFRSVSFWRVSDQANCSRWF